MRSLIRIFIAATFVFLAVSARPAAAATCEGGYGVPQQWETTIRYYSSMLGQVGFEIYTCNDFYIARGVLAGTWMEETDIDCCTGQTQHAYYYLCPTDGEYHPVANLGDTSCS